MTPSHRPTRRNLLAGLGSLGFLGLGSAAARPALGLDPVEFTGSKRLTDAAVQGVDLVLDWRATYGDDVLAETDFEAPGGTAPGPVFRLTDVVPGDEGTLTVRVSAVSAEGVDAASVPPVAVSAWVDLFETAENGRNEPERAAGDDTDDVGELQDALEVTAWYDVGAGDVDAIGGRNGRREPGEERLLDGTLASVASTAEDPVRLEPHSGSRGECFAPNSSVSLTFAWSLDEGVGNVVQSDSVGFAVGFGARPCENGARTAGETTASDPTE